jgi:hypothetical protein
MSRVEIPENLTFEITQVARYHAFAETAEGFTVPDPEFGLSDHHFEFSLPGAVGYPAVLYYRTRRIGSPRFSVRVGDVHVTEYTFTDGDDAERVWHEIIPANTVQPDHNEMAFAVYDDDGDGGSVVFGDVVILYTANQTTVPVPVVVAGAEPSRWVRTPRL